jgi:PIN domain nuclease of toxin-antitoxin system
MKMLLDTHLLLWAANDPERLSAKARAVFDNLEHELIFSAASLWEIAIKNRSGASRLQGRCTVAQARPVGQRLQRVGSYQRACCFFGEFAADP